MIKLEIKGLDKLQELADKYPAISEKHINKAITRSLIRIQDKAKRTAPFGTSGQLRQNWILQVGRFEGRLGSGAKAGGYPYGTSVEEGTKPHYVSPREIELWARRKGLNPYAVARSIAKKGTKANPFFQEATKDAEKEVNEEFDKAIDAIMEEI
jgi:hypothetical protein